MIRSLNDSIHSHKPSLKGPTMVSRRMQQVQSPIIPIVGEWIRATPGTHSLGQGVVHWGPPKEALEAAARFGRAKNGGGSGGAESREHMYSPVGGLPPLVDALEQKLWQQNRIKVMPASRLVVTAGGNMAFMNAALAIADPGDEIILNAPYYFNHEMALAIAGIKPVIVPTLDDYQPDLDAIRDAITDGTRAVVTISPNNPTGAIYPEETLYEINQLCRDAGIYHISDEAYEYFTYGAAAHFSPASIAEAADYTISLFSLSKSHGFASWRIGYMVIPEELHTAIKKIQDTILICPPNISQQAALAAISSGPEFVRRHVTALESSRNLVLEMLDPLGDFLVPGPAQGAFYVYARLFTDIPALRLAEQLVRQYRVAVIPGETFGSTFPAMRIAYAAMSKDILHEALTRFANGIRELLSSRS
jgi:aspartate/methionine/tyrosine aminotransferase